MWQTNFELGIFNAYILFLIYFICSMLPFIFKRTNKTKEINPRSVSGDDFAKVLSSLSFIVFILAIIVSLFLPLIFNSIFFYIGLIIWVIGLITTISVFISWTNTEEGKPVTTGVYKYSRNPMYISFALIFIGISLATISWVFLLIGIVNVIIAIVFVDFEEKSCLEKFGDKYKIYMQNTPRWIGFSKK